MNLLTHVTHSLSLIRFRRIVCTDVGCDLSYQLAVYTLNLDLRILYDRNFDSLWNWKMNVMRKTEI